jgi:hypothetical protein
MRYLRFIYNDYVLNYEELLEKSKMPSLKVRRLRSIAIETFKIIHKESPIKFCSNLIWFGSSFYCLVEK